MITIVSGFFRCGSSLTMQMLDAAGLRCAGVYPAFEVEDPVAAIEGGEFDAVKWLDPERPFPRAECRAIWIDRDDKQQAASARKFLAAIGGDVDAGRLRKTIRAHRARSVALVRRAAKFRLVVWRFECIVADPLAHARELAAFVGCGDPYTMAKVAVSRGPECLPYLLEAELVARWGR